MSKLERCPNCGASLSGATYQDYCPNCAHPLTPERKKQKKYRNMVLRQIRANMSFWSSKRCKRRTVEKYCRENGVPNPAKIIDDLIEEGILHVPKKNYIAFRMVAR